MMARAAIAALAALPLLSCTSRVSEPLPAPAPPAEHYRVVADEGGAWKIDTQSGRLWRCFQGTPWMAGGKSPTCYAAYEGTPP